MFIIYIYIYKHMEFFFELQAKGNQGLQPDCITETGGALFYYGVVYNKLHVFLI